MRYRTIILLGLVLGCRQASVSYQAYNEPSGEFTAEVPAGWGKDYDDAFTRKPIAAVSWIGNLVSGNEGQVVGTVIQVRKLWRLQKDHPSPKDFERYRKNVLEPTAALFDGKAPADVQVAKTMLDGHEARRYQRSTMQSTGGGLHGPVKEYPSKVDGVAVETPTAYYILEYRSTQDRYEKHHPSFERLLGSFHLNPKP